ncbi:AAA family ATPase (plasmid) [Kitasatospora sp. NBC_00070]|uniref:helix-turn-helix transcriptional regulator n=1 Tax=Kitasatospora sp. NBC_00070 TaxID=2975962 RepID=UPI002F918B6A
MNETDRYGTAFVGRRNELAAFNECARHSADGHPGVLTVEGEPGAGKTSLLRHATVAAPGRAVWWATADQAERDLAFGVVRQLIGRADAVLPVPLKEIPGEQPVSAVGPALAQLMENCQQRAPLVAVVDNLQWADTPSIEALAFVARRLWRQRILLVGTVRSGPAGPRTEPPYDRFDSIRLWDRLVTATPWQRTVSLEGFTANDIVQLAAKHGHVLDYDTAERLRLHTGGVAAHVRAMLLGPSTTALDQEEQLPAPQLFALTVRQILERSSPDAMSLAQAVAVFQHRVPLAVAGHVAGVDEPTAALGQLLDAGLVHWWPGPELSLVAMASPLHQAAVRECTTAPRRRALHLAAVPLSDTYSAWGHRVAAASRVDGSLAAELEAAAEENLAVGRLGNAAQLLTWAAGLSPDQELRTRYLTTAFEYRLQTGDLGHAYRMAERVRHGASERKLALLGQLALARAEFDQAEGLFREAATAAQQAGDSDSQALALVLLGATHLTEFRAGPAAESLTKALELGLPTTHLLHIAQTLLTLVEGGLYGPHQALQLLERRVKVPVASRTRGAKRSLLLARGVCRCLAGQLRSGIDDLSSLVQTEGDETFSNEGIAAEPLLALFQYVAGDWASAAARCEHVVALVEKHHHRATDYVPAHAATAILAASRGHWHEAHEHHRAAVQRAQQVSIPADPLYLALSAASLAEQARTPDAQLNALKPLEDCPEDLLRLWRSWWLPLRAEALISAGQFGEGRAALAELTDLAQQTPYLLPWAARCAGALAEAHGKREQALQHYREGLVVSGSDESPLQRARLSHCLGRLLAQSDPGGAIGHLGAAHRTYLLLGAEPLAEDAARDLEGCGVPAPSRVVLLQLTIREADTVGLAGRGRTNLEIAGELGISTKTVEYHLRHAYVKLGITSRRELPSVVPQEPR